MKKLLHRIESWRVRIDPYVTRGVGKAYRKGMALFWWYGVFISLSSAFVDSYMTLFALALGATGVQVGALASFSSFFGMLMPLPGALWAAHWGKRKPVVLISFGLRYLALLFALLTPLAAHGTGAVFLVIGFFALRAAFMYMATPPWTSFAGDIVPMDRRGRYFSSRKTAMALASLIFVPLAGQLIGLFPEPVGYQISFGLSILWGVIALFLFARVPERAPSAGRSQGGSQTRVTLAFWKILRRSPDFWRFTLISMLFNFAWQFGGPYFGVYQVEVLGATARIIGLLSMAGSLMRMLGQQVWGRAVDHRGARWAFSLCLLFIPVLPFIWLPLTRPWQLVFVTMPSGFLWAGREVANFNLLLELSDEEEKTQAIASYNTLLALANIVGPLVGGQVVRWLGYHWAFALSGFGRLVAALLFVALLKPFTFKRLRQRWAVE